MDKGAFSPRHGTVIQITEKEFEILKKIQVTDANRKR